MHPGGRKGGGSSLRPGPDGRHTLHRTAACPCEPPPDRPPRWGRDSFLTHTCTWELKKNPKKTEPPPQKRINPKTQKKTSKTVDPRNMRGLASLCDRHANRADPFSLTPSDIREPLQHFFLPRKTRSQNRVLGPFGACVYKKLCVLCLENKTIKNLAKIPT